MASSNNTSTAVLAGGLPVASILYIAGETLIAALTALGNGAVIAAVVTRHQLQNVTNYFVASLAAADFFVGVFAIPCAVVSFVGLRQSYGSCALVNVVIIILTQISMFGLCAVAVERFVAIKYPYRYANSCTVKLCAATIGTIWLTGVVVGVIPLLVFDTAAAYDGRCAFTAVIDMRHVVYVHFFVSLLIPLTFMFFIYWYIFHVVRQQVHRIAALRQMSVDDGGQAAFRKDAKAAKWFAVVILFFVISWFPLDIMNAVTLYGGPTCQPCLLPAIILSHANSAINPILYAFANSKFKAALKQMLRTRDDNGDVSANQETQYN
ncbi:hypothetical protein LSH36_83g06053 [Paralvinella palmiformis]|uniref:G-protein coupled receptors family 1 profile domain-containing protein n=1 Tax=Paralvinella palmiformis TaxID=53620 RepID=A0AAD9K1Q0_9ANNE|nr:hypothetical protein LSH36_83g06053 [Paralvinella palmiformis]